MKTQAQIAREKKVRARGLEEEKSEGGSGSILLI